jgi:membrane protease YdiL (CAAX protease family)
VISAALLRGSYHLYQGFGGFVGNIAMGIIFGAIYLRTKRLLPLITAHVVIDTVAFVGYPTAVVLFPDVFA